MSRAAKDLPFLVGGGAGGFHVTNAGREIVRKPRRFPVVPGTPLAAELIALARAGRGKVHNTLEKKHAAAIADNAKKASHVFPGRGDDGRRDAEADDRPFVCTVCLAPVGPGGRKTAPAKCARCYQRERRKQPEAPRSTAEPRDQSVTFQISKTLREQLERHAAKMKITLSTLLARIVCGEIRVDVRRPA